jgi:hypothetical protein
MATDKTLTIIRAKLDGFVKARQKAYQAVVAKGKMPLDYAEKISAILMLRVQLEASSGWDLTAHLKWISAMRPQIMAILPAANSESPRMLKFRKHMLDLLGYCDDLADSKPLFQQNRKAA